MILYIGNEFHCKQYLFTIVIKNGKTTRIMLNYKVYKVHKQEIIAIVIFMEGWKIKEAQFTEKYLLEENIWGIRYCT